MIKSTVNKLVVSSTCLAQLIIFSTLFFAAPQLVLAQPAPAGWIDQQAALVSPEVAQATITQREQTLIQQRSLQAKQRSLQAATAGKTTLAAQQASTIQSAAAIVPAASEFTQVAADLENDPRRIYQFVRNHFTYVPYYGALKGPYLTLKERSGNDFDPWNYCVRLVTPPIINTAA